MRFYKTKDDAHFIEVREIREMGGGVEEYLAWCHKCDPKGIDTMTRDYSYPVQDVLYALALDIAEHCGFALEDAGDHMVRVTNGSVFS